MRTKVWKDALYLGTWVTPDGTVFDCGPDDMQHFYGRAKAMLGKGSPIPWCIEHKKNVGLSREEQIDAWAKSIKGHMHDARMHGDVMQVQIDVDDADRPQLEALKFVSPEIRFNVRDRYGPARDDTGPYWPGGSIAHIAVTGVPVQFPQKPFNFSPGIQGVSLSRAGVTVSLSAATYLQVGLSMADATGHEHNPAGEGGGQFASAASAKAHESSSAAEAATEKATAGHSRENHQAAESAHMTAQIHHLRAQNAHGKDGNRSQSDLHGQEAEHHQRMADIHRQAAPVSLSMADKPNPFEKDDDKPGDDAADTDVEDIRDDETPTPAPDAGDVAGDTALIHRLSQSIAELGMVVEPTPGMDLRNYIEHLCTAVASHKATKSLTDDAKPDQPDANPQPNANDPTQLPEVAETPPVMMSAALQAENAALKARLGKAIQSERNALRDRLAAHCSQGNITKDHANSLIAELKTVSLSALSSPALDKVVAELAVLDRLVKDGRLKSAFRTETTVSLSAAGVIETVEDAVETRKGDRERQEAAGDELAARAGAPIKKSA
jgi:hypothetical protein